VFKTKIDLRESSSSSDCEEESEIIAAIDEKKNKGRRVRAINEKRETLGECHRLVQELKKDPKRFHVYFRTTI